MPMKSNTSQNRPDDVCALCSYLREEHGDKNHKFSVEGELIPIEPGPPPRQEAPKARDSTPEAQVLGNDPVTKVVLRMVERMVSKQLLSGEDLVYIFGGGSNPAH